MFMVTGATGQLGRAIVHKLVERVPASQVGATCRDVDKAADLRALGVRVRQADFEDPTSLQSAFEGVTQLLLVSSNASARGGDPVAQHRNAIEAARAAGAERIVYTSHMAASDISAFKPMHDHHATEALLRASELPFTSLRNGFYARSGIDLMGNGLETGEFEAPADGKVSWTAHADLAEAAAIILTENRSIEGPTPPLTASEALDLADLAAIATELLGRPIRRTTISDETLRANMQARGAPDRATQIVLGLYTASRNREFATVDPTLQNLLGRPPLTMRNVLEELAPPKR